MLEIDFYTQSEESIVQQANEKLLTANEDWEKHIWQFINNWFNPAIETITIFTSGSTGEPKQMEHTKSAMLNSAGMTCAVLNLKAGDKAFLCLPVNKIAGMMMIVRSIHQKMKLLCIRPSTTPLTELPEHADINFAAFTPMQFYGITNDHTNFTKAAHIHKIILGGEDVRTELMQHILKLKAEVYITFGMTETISHIALKRLNGPSPDKNFKVLPGVKISVNERSCLVIKAPHLNQPHLVTNDVVEILSPTEFKWLGRVDNVINSGGVKIYPEEIEQQLANMIDVPFFIAAKPNERSGQKLVLVLETDSFNPGNTEKLNNAIGGLQKLHRPKEILLVPQFIRTANGKIKRAESVLQPKQSLDLLPD